MSKIGTRAFVFIVVALLGLVSSVITAIVAAIACFAIGIGAVLTPIGEPYNASFWFLLAAFYRYILPGIFGFGILAVIVVRKGIAGGSLSEDRAEGMLIPGNIPNIIAAGKLRIKSKEWLAVGVPVGIGAMTVCFAILLMTRA